MKRGLQSQACGLEQLLLFTVLMIVGLSPAVRSAWGQDETARAWADARARRRLHFLSRTLTKSPPRGATPQRISVLGFLV